MSRRHCLLTNEFPLLGVMHACDQPIPRPFSPTFHRAHGGKTSLVRGCYLISIKGFFLGFLYSIQLGVASNLDQP